MWAKHCLEELFERHIREEENRERIDYNSHNQHGRQIDPKQVDYLDKDVETKCSHSLGHKSEDAYRSHPHNLADAPYKCFEQVVESGDNLRALLLLNRCDAEAENESEEYDLQNVTLRQCSYRIVGNHPYDCTPEGELGRCCLLSGCVSHNRCDAVGCQSCTWLEYQTCGNSYCNGDNGCHQDISDAYDANLSGRTAAAK